MEPRRPCCPQQHHSVSISHIGMERKFRLSKLNLKGGYKVSISHIGMEQQHLVVKSYYNTYILICQ